MRTLKLLLAFFIVLGTTPMALAHDDRDDRNTVRARLSGYNEVHFIAAPPALRGAVSTPASGRFTATIDDRNQMIHYEISYSGLVASVTQSHIHFGQPRTVGGIVVWLCQTVAPFLDPAGVAPTCPQSGTVTGTIRPAQVLTVTGQGIDAGEFDELVRAIRAGATYANVHSQTFGPGEIRGPIGGDDD